MVQVLDPSTSVFCIDVFEASRPDATSSSAGTDTSRALSQEGVIPWTGVSFDGARAACEAATKRPCRLVEFTAACRGAGGMSFPYGDAFQSGACNDSSAPSGGLAPTGSYSSCASTRDGAQLYDLSGNAAEWVQDGSQKGVAGGSFQNTGNDVSCVTFDDVEDTAQNPSWGFRCCL